MKAQIYTVFPGVITITAETLRSEPRASAKFTAANVHQDFIARVGAVMREHKHIGQTALAFPAAQRLQTYFPVFPLVTGNPLYAIRELVPLGAVSEFVGDWQMEQSMMRYQFMLNWLPAALIADEEVAQGMTRNIVFAVKKLFQANNIPDVYLPGDVDVRVMDRTEIDVTCDLGQGSGRVEVEIPSPAA